MASDSERLGRLLEEVRIGEWSVAHFEHASLCRHPERGTHEIPNPIRDYWKNGLIDRAGFPRQALRETTLFDRPMHAVEFDGAVVYWDPATDVVFHASPKDGPTDTDIISRLAASLFGRWDDAFQPGVIGVHAALLHTNEVLFWTYYDPANTPPGSDVVAQGEWSVLSLKTGQVVAQEVSDRNQFCSGQCLLGDGRVLAVGGDRKSPAAGQALNARTVRLYVPGSRTWIQGPDLEPGRWYPTVAPYESTTAFVVGGRDRTSTPESGHKSVRSAMVVDMKDAGAPFATFLWPFYNFDHGFGVDWGPHTGEVGDTYPFVFVLPNGRLFVHLANRTRLPLLPQLDFATALAAEDPTGPRTYDQQGTAVLLPLRPTDGPPYRARVMLVGGGEILPSPAKNTCMIMDTTAAKPEWKPAARLKGPRHMGDAVLLPDGKVLVVNGAQYGLTHGTPEDQARLAAEIYDPATDQWTEMAAMKTARMYHSTALLLPDGRVMSAGSDRTWNTSKAWKRHIEVFSPPYLFKGPRPTLWSAPASARYSETIFVRTDDYESVKSAVLIRNGSCTHSFNADQRFIDLMIMKRVRPRPSLSLERVVSRIRSLTVTFLWPNLIVSGGLQVRTPPNESVAPPGYYMLFLVSDKRVPSVARFIRLGGHGTREPWFTVTRAEGRSARG